MGSWPLSSCSCITPLPVTVSCVWNPPLKETSPTLSTYNMLSCQGYVDNLKGAGSQFLSKALFCFECFKWLSKVFLIVNQTLSVIVRVISEKQVARQNSVKMLVIMIQILCPFSGNTLQQYNISISLDGTTFSSPHTFTVYDSVCYQCDVTGSCHLKVRNIPASAEIAMHNIWISNVWWSH